MGTAPGPQSPGVPAGWQERYHVPWSQVHPGSRGGQTGHVHLHRQYGAVKITLTTVAGRRVRITRREHQALCLARGWYERDPEGTERTESACPRCTILAARYGVDWCPRTGA